MADHTSGPPLRDDPFQGTNFRALRRLGSARTGEVYAVEHVGIGRELVAKVLHAHLTSNLQSADRLRLEGQALARLSHPNVVSVEGCDRTRDGRAFLIMERLHGRTLARELELRGSLSVGVAVDYAIQVLCALEAVHGIGVVHRDVRPESIFLAEAGDGAARVKLIDFGLVRVLPSAVAGAPAPLAVATESGEVMGTPRFVSPEGARGQRVDAGADIYAAALVLYTMLAGRGPFDHADGRRAMVDAHTSELPAPPSRYAAEPIPAELDALVLGALAKDPKDRPASAREFRGQLERLTALLAQPMGWLRTTKYDAGARARDDSGLRPRPEAVEVSPGHEAGGRTKSNAKATPRPEDWPERRRASHRTLVVAVILALSGLIASSMAVVGVVTVLRGGR